MRDILDSLVTVPGFDIGHYNRNGDELLDHLFLVVKADFRLVGRGGIAELDGYEHYEGDPGFLEYWSDSLQAYVEIDWGRSGSINIAQSWSVRDLIAHEYGHDYFGMGHTTMLTQNDVPLIVPPPNQKGHNACTFNRMCGDRAPNGSDLASFSLSGHEMRRMHWVDRTVIEPSAGDQLGLTIRPLYTSGEVVLIPLANADADTLSIENRQRNNFFDAHPTHLSPQPYGTYWRELATTGLFVTLSDGVPDGSSSSYRYDIVPPDNQYARGERCTGGSSVGCLSRDAHEADMHRPEIATQITPWTRPNVSGYTLYDGQEPNWFAITNIHYDDGVAPVYDMVFDFVADVRDGFTITRDSWIGAETSGEVLTGLITVADGATLTVEADTELTFADGLLVETGAALVVEQGATLKFGPGQALEADGLLTVEGTSANPVAFLRQNTAQAWDGIIVDADESLIVGATVSGATVGVDLRAQSLILEAVTLSANGTGLLTDFAACAACSGLRSSFVLTGSTVEDATGIGVHARNTNGEITDTAITGSSSHGLLVQNADLTVFTGNTVEDNGDSPGVPNAQTAGLAAIANGDLVLAGDGGSSGFNVVRANAMHETGVDVGGTLVIGLALAGIAGDNSIYKTSGGPGPNARYVLNGSGVQVRAEDVWWNQTQGPPLGAFAPTNSVDANPHLPCDWQSPPCQSRLFASAVGAAGSTVRGTETTRWLGQEIRETRAALALAPGAPEAREQVLYLAQLQRLDRGDALGEHEATWALLDTLAAGLGTTLLHEPASSAAFRVAVQEAVRTGDNDGAQALLDTLGTAVTDLSDVLALDLARVVLFEAAGDYASALSQLEAVRAGLTEAQGLLAEALFHTAAVLERRLSGEGGGRGPDVLASASSLVGLPSAYALDAAYPNPFTGQTTVPFALPEGARVRVEVYDLLGRRVAELADGAYEAGHHTAVLDGHGLASGVYVVRATMEAGAEGSGTTRSFTRRVTLLR